MVIYGTKKASINQVTSRAGVCPNCKKEGTLVFTIYRKHFHIFWIPIFPFKKRGLCKCSNCGTMLKQKELPEYIKNEYVNIKDAAKGPIWQFVGLLLIAILAVFIFMRDKEHTAEELSYLKNPQAGDVYELKMEKGVYTTFKIDHVTIDSLFIIPNEYETDKFSGLYKVDKEENYADYNYGVSRTEINEMYESKKIIDINRKD